MSLSKYYYVTAYVIVAYVTIISDVTALTDKFIYVNCLNTTQGKTVTYHHIKNVFVRIVLCHCRKKFQNYGQLSNVTTYTVKFTYVVAHTLLRKVKTTYNQIKYIFLQE